MRINKTTWWVISFILSLALLLLALFLFLKDKGNFSPIGGATC